MFLFLFSFFLFPLYLSEGFFKFIFEFFNCILKFQESCFIRPNCFYHSYTFAFILVIICLYKRFKTRPLVDHFSPFDSVPVILWEKLRGTTTPRLAQVPSSCSYDILCFFLSQNLFIHPAHSCLLFCTFSYFRQEVQYYMVL